MFETIGNLLTIAFWVIAIGLLVFGIFLCFTNLFSGTGWEKFWAILAIILGAFAFYGMYVWLESILWCLFATGLVLCSVGSATVDKGQDDRPEGPNEPGWLEELADDLVKRQQLEESIEKAIRKSKE